MSMTTLRLGRKYLCNAAFAFLFYVSKDFGKPRQFSVRISGNVKNGNVVLVLNQLSATL
jgi:hypothetical protein